MATITTPTPGTHFSNGLSGQTAITVASPVDPSSYGARFQLNLTGAETGSNAGSNFQLQAIADDGTTIVATPISVTRSTGVLSFSSGAQTQAGSSTAFFSEEGNVNRQISAAGVQPGGTAVDSVLAVYTLPASAFDVAGRGMAITAEGSFGATGNNKRVKLIFNATTAVVGSAVTGGTTIGDTGTVTTNGGGWCVQANVFKYGATGSNTQLGLHQQAQVGGAVAALLAPAAITAVESGAILIAVTGNAATAVSDIVFNFLEINFMN